MGDHRIQTAVACRYSLAGPGGEGRVLELWTIRPGSQDSGEEGEPGQAAWTTALRSERGHTLLWSIHISEVYRITAFRSLLSI
jgi:hypothetical protein